MVDLIVLACIAFAFGIISRRLEGTVLTAPIAFVLAGAVLGPAGFGLVEMGLEDHAVLLLGEIALALVLFTDAARTDLSVLRTRLAGVSVLFAGWLGPWGLASIVLGLIVVAEAPHLAGRDEIETVVASTVLLNVLLHGITAAPLSAAYAPGRGDGRRRAGAARSVDTPGLRLYPCSR